MIDQDILWDYLLNDLPAGLLAVEFTKVDGSRRKMLCTTNANIIPPLPIRNENSKSRKPTALDVKVVWSVKDNSWRSIRKVSLISVKRIENEGEYDADN
jgi:hypothetical protein